VQDYPDREAMTGVWIPLPFFSDEALPGALKSVREMLRPGGWMFTMCANPLPGGMARAVTNLRDVLWGGAPRTAEQALHAMQEAGFESVQKASEVPGVPFKLLVARRPD